MKMCQRLDVMARDFSQGTQHKLCIHSQYNYMRRLFFVAHSHQVTPPTFCRPVVHQRVSVSVCVVVGVGMGVVCTGEYHTHVVGIGGEGVNLACCLKNPGVITENAVDYI